MSTWKQEKKVSKKKWIEKYLALLLHTGFSGDGTFKENQSFNWRVNKYLKKVVIKVTTKSY